MVKRFGAAWIAAMMILCLLFSFSAAGFARAEETGSAAAAAAGSETRAGETRIWDECGLLTESEKAQLQQVIDEVQEEYQMDCGVLTTGQVPKNRSDRSEEKTVEYADAWYEKQGMGIGEDRAGILYVLDMNNRVSYVSTAGVMIDYLDDSRKEELLSSADENLGKRKYGGAILNLLRTLQGILARGIREGHFRYDEATGRRLTGLYNKLTTAELVVAGFGGAFTAGLVVLVISMRYGLKRRTYQFNKSTQSSVNYTVDEQTFLRQTVHRTRISSGGGGGRGGGGGGHGSGVHVSSGGMSHGGGGHHF